MLVSAILLLTLFAPGIVAYKLRRTRAWWVTGIAVALGGVYLFLTLDHADHHGEPGYGYWYGVGNFIQICFGVFLLVYALILLAAAREGRKSRPKEPAIPRAQVL